MAHPSATRRASYASCLAVIALLASQLSACSADPGRSAAPREATAALGCAARIRAATVSVTDPARNVDRQWGRYFDSNSGVTGADSGYGYAVPGVGTIWTFADAFVGGLLSHDRRRGHIVHNLAVVFGPHGSRVVVRGAKPPWRPLVGPQFGLIFYLSLAGTVDGGSLQVLMARRRWENSNYSLDNVAAGTAVATFALPGLRLESLRSISGDGRVQWGADVGRFGRWTYVYGASSDTAAKAGYVARVAGPDLNGRWSYWDGSGWSSDPGRAAPVLRNVQAEFSVTPLGGAYVVVASDQLPRFTSEASVYLGCSPVGPFVKRSSFILTPLVGPVGSARWGDRYVYAYDARVEPVLSHGSGLVVAYDQNSLNFHALFRNAGIYRPYFLELHVRLP